MPIFSIYLRTHYPYSPYTCARHAYSSRTSAPAMPIPPAYLCPPLPSPPYTCARHSHISSPNLSLLRYHKHPVRQYFKPKQSILPAALTMILFQLTLLLILLSFIITAFSQILIDRAVLFKNEMSCFRRFILNCCSTWPSSCMPYTTNA